MVSPLGGETLDMGTGGSTEQQKLAWEWVEGMQQASTMEHVTSLMYYLPSKPAVTAQFLKGGGGFGCSFPGRVQIPAIPVRVVADVVADST